MSKKNKGPNKPYTRLESHKRDGKVLKPPLRTVDGLALASWPDDRLPEMLWAALIVTSYERDAALARFRRALNAARDAIRKDIPPVLTQSGLAEASVEEQNRVLSVICSGQARSVLRALLLLPNLPARAKWAEFIQDSPPESDWATLKRAVALTFWHQSQEATDLRWVRVMGELAREKIVFPEGAESTLAEVVGYPNEGDQRQVRPTIRSMEGGLVVHGETSTWAKIFWDDCLRLTLCDLSSAPEPKRPLVAGTTRARFDEVRAALVAHEGRTRATTAPDPRHEGAFAIALYCFAILDELLRVGISTSILARSAVRTLVECAVTLSYLAHEDSTERWQQFRAYGAGQAKLALLKFLREDRPPSHVDADTLDALANEDRWLEFVNIDLGHWDSLDLRKMSDRAGTKPLYDRFYQWTSGFVHGHWTAVRDATLATCWNPLHRLHRVARRAARELNDVLPDACELVDQVLGLVDKLYPSFSPRVSIQNP